MIFYTKNIFFVIFLSKKRQFSKISTQIVCFTAIPIQNHANNVDFFPKKRHQRPEIAISDFSGMLVYFTRYLLPSLGLTVDNRWGLNRAFVPPCRKSKVLNASRGKTV